LAEEESISSSDRSHMTESVSSLEMQNFGQKI